MALGNPSRDQVFLRTFGTPQPITNSPFSDMERNAYDPTPNQDASVNTHGTPVTYIPLNPEIAKAYVIHPTNQGQRAAIAQRETMMFQPRNSPSRSQFSQGYTNPIQEFEASLLWDTPSGQHTAGKRQSQPSMKFVGPTTPIVTRMPWDL